MKIDIIESETGLDESDPSRSLFLLIEPELFLELQKLSHLSLLLAEEAIE